MGHIWELLDFVMVCAIFPYAISCRHCRIFWAIQVLQLFEILILFALPGWQTWYFLDRVNLFVELLTIPFMVCHFRFAASLMGLHAAIKIKQYYGFDCDWQFFEGNLFFFRASLNRLIILALIAYPLAKAIIRRLESYAEYFRSAAPY